jgi:hypothetical protein
VGTFISGFRTRCNAEVFIQNDYTYVDFAFPEPLVNSGDAVRVVLDYGLVDAVCTAEDGDLYLHEQTSNQWASPVQSTVYAVCMPSASVISWSPDLRSEWDGHYAPTVSDFPHTRTRVYKDGF